MRLSTLCLLAVTLSWSCLENDHVRVGRVEVDRDADSYPTITFNLAWDHSFRDTVNWDGAWVFAKYRVNKGPWLHARLSTQTIQTVANDHGVPATITVGPDGRGAFVHRNQAGTGAVDWEGVTLRWFDETDERSKLDVRVFALEMVYIPSGPFRLGDGEIGNVRGHFGAGGSSQPFRVTNEAGILLGGGALGSLSNSNAYGMDGPATPPFEFERQPDDFTDGRMAMLPTGFPKGFRAFYVMKHELTQGQYAAFLNSLTASQQQSRNPASLRKKNQAAIGLDRYTITAVPPFSASSPDRAMNFLSWEDATAYADWAGLRPLTEMEFEKTARGPRMPEPGEFAWGTSRVHAGRYRITNHGTPSEQVANASRDLGNAAYSNTMGPLERSCRSCIRGPLRVGVFSGPGVSRVVAGASPFGVTELSGNVAERYVTVGHEAGRRFDGMHGDGELDSTGAAWGREALNWPGSEPTGGGGRVTSAAGTGFRGGGWASPVEQLGVANRELAATADNSRHGTFGARFGRTDPLAAISPSQIADSVVADSANRQ